MAQTFKLTDGGDIDIDLLPTDQAVIAHAIDFEPLNGQPIIAGHTLTNVRYRPRTVQVGFTVREDSAQTAITALRSIEHALQVAEARSITGVGSPVKLVWQHGNTAANDVAFRVLRGDVQVPPDALSRTILEDQGAVRNARLNLLIEPFGTLATVEPTATTVVNEQDGTNVNYIDLEDITGTHEARLQLKVHDPSTSWDGSARIWIARRSGGRMEDTLFFQGEAGTTTIGDSPFASGTQSSDGDDVSDSNASGSGDNVARVKWTTTADSYEVESDFTKTGDVSLTVAGGSVPTGLFRVLARVRIDGNPFSRPFTSDRYDTETATGFAMGWSYGGRSYEPVEGDEVYLDEDDDFQMVDLGEIALPPVALPDGFTTPALTLTIHTTWKPPGSFSDVVNNRTYYVQWDVDYVMLFPIDEGAVVVNDVSTTDRLLLDTFRDTSGVYLLSSSDVIQEFADFDGAPFRIGPEDTRIYVLRDDNTDPSSVEFTLTPSYIPQVTNI